MIEGYYGRMKSPPLRATWQIGNFFASMLNSYLFCDSLAAKYPTVNTGSKCSIDRGSRLLIDRGGAGPGCSKDRDQIRKEDFGGVHSEAPPFRLSGRRFQLDGTWKEDVVFEVDVLMQVLFEFPQPVVERVEGRAGVLWGSEVRA